VVGNLQPVRLLRRPADPAAPADPGSAPAPSPVGKGRPTPKRREAESRRRTPVAASANRKEAAKLTREQAKERRIAARTALRTGDERHLPARDAGPVRRFARDYVDARRNVAALFFPAAIVALALSTFQPASRLSLTGSLVLVAYLLALIGDSILIARGVQRQVAARFPGEKTHGIGLYAAMRASQFRRFRLPPAKVKRGAKV